MSAADEMRLWLATGCVTDDYMQKVLGDQSVTVSTDGKTRWVRILTKSDIGEMKCPFPPEPAWS